MKTIQLILSAIFSLVLLTSCSSSEDNYRHQDPVAFESTDECHVCGMVISRFPGPKGQAFETRSQQTRKFCSTMEMIFWYLQPENQPNVSQMYVHDMSQSHWDSPKDEHLIAARDAFYVINSKQQGSMGKTLASFLSSNDAAKFAKENGGEVVSFNGLSLPLLAQ